MENETNTTGQDPKMVQVSSSVLETMQKQMLDMEIKMESQRGEIEGLKVIREREEDGDARKLRTKRNFEPKFRTARLRKYPFAGNYDDQRYVVGWTARGAYQEVDRTGISPTIVDYIDIMFLGEEKPQKVRLLDLLNDGIQEHCKIVNVEKKVEEVGTGEEIGVTEFDSQHGTVLTGDKVDGMTVFQKFVYEVQIPGHDGTVMIEEKFIN